MEPGDDLLATTRNMLEACGGIPPGSRVCIVAEQAGLGYYDDALAPAIKKAAGDLGYRVELHRVPHDPGLTEPDPATAAAMARADATVFLARMGDQIRFRPAARFGRVIICYALDLAMAAGAYGRLDHAAMLALRALLDGAFARASLIRLTCPAGSDYAGRILPGGPAPVDTPARRFPLSVFTPIPASGFSGRIAQRGFLVGTGSSFYEPYAIPIEETLNIDLRGGRITGFSGPSARAAKQHYETVAGALGINPYAVHSWHAGIHPGLSFPDAASRSFQRWSGGAFGNPRLLHFHTCGDYAPGEICLNLLDPTIEIDGVAVWEAGRLHPDRLPGGSRLLAAHPDLAALLARPARDCGEAAGGGLAFA